MTTKERENIKVIHRMADGTVLDSVAGIVVPATEEFAVAYELMAKYSVRKEAKS